MSSSAVAPTDGSWKTELASSDVSATNHSAGVPGPGPVPVPVPGPVCAHTVLLKTVTSAIVSTAAVASSQRSRAGAVAFWKDVIWRN